MNKNSDDNLYREKLAKETARIDRDFVALGISIVDRRRVIKMAVDKSFTTVYRMNELIDFWLDDVKAHGKETDQSKWLFE
jgi:hypothetical protein